MIALPSGDAWINVPTARKAATHLGGDGVTATYEAAGEYNVDDTQDDDACTFSPSAQGCTKHRVGDLPTREDMLVRVIEESKTRADRILELEATVRTQAEEIERLRSVCGAPHPFDRGVTCTDRLGHEGRHGAYTAIGWAP